MIPVFSVVSLLQVVLLPSNRNKLMKCIVTTPAIFQWLTELQVKKWIVYSPLLLS